MLLAQPAALALILIQNEAIDCSGSAGASIPPGTNVCLTATNPSGSTTCCDPA